MAGFKEYSMLFKLSASNDGSFAAAFQAGQTSVTQLQQKINDLNKTQADIASYQKQQNAIDKTKGKIELYQNQLNNLKSATATTSVEEKELANAILAKEKQLNDSNDKLAQQNALLSEMGAALREAGVDTNNLASESERLKAESQEVAQAQKEEAEAAQQAGQTMREAFEGATAALEALGAVEALKKVYGDLMECSRAAAEFETSMAAVKRTVGGDDAFISDLGESFKQMSTVMPITSTELANIATTAGQLGIAQENVETFTLVMAQLATTTDLSADNAATMLAQFANITGTTDYERLGSTVAALGDATATTASKVVDMSQGMAAAASIAGMSETDILAIAAAVGSLGIEAASGSTSMSTLISNLYKATETGDKLEDYAAVAGMTGAEFKRAWGEDAAGALNMFIQGLNDTERNGKSAVVILDELGITNVRQTKAILGLAQAGDLLGNTIQQANAAWNQNTALTEKAGIMYNTTEAKMTMMQNAANNVKIAIGDALNPALSGLYDAATAVMEPVAEWLEANPWLVTGITAFVTVLGVAVAAITAFTAASKLAAAAAALFGGAIPGLGVILGVAGVVAALAAGITALGNANSSTADTFRELDAAYDSMLEEAKHQQAILDLVDNYKALNEEMSDIQSLMNGDFNTEIHFTAKGPEDAGKLSPDDFVDDTTVTLTPAQAEMLKGTDFLTDAKVNLTPDAVQHLAAKDFLTNTRVELDAYQHSLLTSESFLRSTKVKLTPEQKEKLNSEDFFDGDRIIELTPEQAKQLAATDFFDGSVVQLTAEQANELLAADFLGDGSEIELTAKAAKALKASEFMLEPTAEITGAAGNTLTAADFGLSEQTVTFLAQMDGASVADVKAQASALKSEITENQAQINELSNSLKQSEQYAANLQRYINTEQDKKKKSSMQAQLDEVTDSITKQKDKLEELKTKNADLQSQYDVVGTAAEELQAKEDALTEAKLALADASGIVAGASAEAAAAFDQEAAAAERDAEAQLALIRASLYDNISQQTKNYSQHVDEAKEATDRYNRAAGEQAVANKLQGKRAEEVNEAYMEMLHTLDEMEAAEGWSPDDEAYRKAVAEAEDWISLMGSMDMHGIQEDADRLSNGMVNWADSFGYLKTNGTAWNYTLEDLNSDIVEYKAQMDEAKGSQSEFINNLVEGIDSGAVKAEEVEARLKDALAGEADAEETVAAIMAEVNAGVEAAAAAKEEYAEASEEAAAANQAEESTIDGLLQQILNLEKAYSDAYKAAYESINGQFKLFESAAEQTKDMNKGYEGGIEKMTDGLQSQKTYIDQYAANYASANTAFENAGVSAETANAILGNLADGSVESAQALQTLATASTEELTAMAEAYESLQESKETYASTIAEIQTSFNDTMAALAADLDATIQKTDFSTEAGQNALKSMQAFGAQIEAYKGEAAGKAAQVAAAIEAALDIHPTITVSVVPSFSGLLGKLFGHARGTENAPKGLTWVGEEGPELMYMNGGEHVMNHQKSVNYARSHNLNGEEAEPMQAESSGGGNTSNVIHVDFSPVYNVSGSNASEVRAVLEEHDQNLRERVEDIMEDVYTDRMRTSYA